MKYINSESNHVSKYYIQNMQIDKTETTDHNITLLLKTSVCASPNNM